MKLAVTLLLAGVCLYGQEVHTGYFRGHKVTYKVVDGMAITEGDILLGTAEQLAASSLESDSKNSGKEAIGVFEADYLWPNATIPYAVDPALPNQQRITDAVQHWNDNSAVHLVKRTNERNYIRFTRTNSGCYTYVGYLAIGEQKVNIDTGCDTGAVIHEIGHAAGLYHEQSRQDRDFYIRVRYENLDKREFPQYEQQLYDGTDAGGYDFGSIMHYSPQGFSRNDLPTIETIPAGIPIGQRERLSAGDLDAVARLYNAPINQTTVTSFPIGLQVNVDGQTYKTPQKFDWAPGSQHSIEAPAQPDQANVKYAFGRWSDDGTAAHTVVASEATTVYSANYVQLIRPRAIPKPTQGGRVEISPASADGFYPADTVLTLTPIPNAGYSFSGWSGYGYTSILNTTISPLRYSLEDPDIEYDPKFSTSKITTIASNPPGQKIKVDGSEVTTPRAFTWAPGSTHTVAVANTTQDNYAGTARYVFEGWSDGGDVSHSVTAGADGGTVTAQFRAQYLVQADVAQVGGMVQLSPAPRDNFFDAGATVTAMPIPSGSYQFSNWTGDVGGNSAPASFRVDDQVLFNANFAIPRTVTAESIVSAANYLGGAVAPGQIVTLFGLNFGPDRLTLLALDAQQRVSTSLAGVRILFDGTPAPLVYVSANQISAVVPYNVASKTRTRISLEYNGQALSSTSVPVVAAAPALFTYDSTGRGLAAALNENGSVNSDSNPAARGSVVVLYATGEGVTSPAGEDGKPAAAPLPRPVRPIRVIIAGRTADVLYAGGAPGLVAGVMQINVRVPVDCPAGDVPVTIAAGNAASPANVAIAVR